MFGKNKNLNLEKNTNGTFASKIGDSGLTVPLAMQLIDSFRLKFIL